MTAFLWTVFILAFSYWWLKGHWFPWIVVWLFGFLLYQLVDNKPSDTSHDVWMRVLIACAVASIPMGIKELIAYFKDREDQRKATANRHRDDPEGAN